MAYHSAEASGSMEEDSPWMDEGDDEISNAALPLHDSAQQAISQQEWDKLAQRYSDAGYKEGITSGKESNLQTGFDQGFTLAAPYARRVGLLRGVSSSILSLLTTTASAKHRGFLASVPPEQMDELVSQCRALVLALGKLDEERVLPVDEEARDHAKSHDESNGGGWENTEKSEMRDLERALEGLGSNGKQKDSTIGLEECSEWLRTILASCGLESGLLN